MRVLALSDIHSDEMVIEKLRVFLERNKFDLVLIAGDITNRGPVSYAEEFLGLFSGMNVLAIHGNMDPKPVVDLLERRGIFFHCKRVRIGEWAFVGFGGSSPTPFGTPTEYPEDEIEEELSKVRIDEKTVLVTHSPPYDSGFDRTRIGMKAGSKAIRKIIEEKRPFMNICGHIHESEGIGMLNGTKIVKLPPAEKCKAVEILLREGEVRFMEF